MKSNPFLALKDLYSDPELQAIHREMVQWMQGTYAWVDGTLSTYPPAWPEPAARRQALFLLDEPLHVLSAPIEPCLNAFLNRRIERVVEEIEREVVTSGVTLWKLYNHGFVVKTPEITIGFDLHRGPFATFQIESALFDRILATTQALFISHAHSDHADADAIPRMVALGRPVIVPPGLWEGNTIYHKLTKPERDGKSEKRLALGNAEITYRVFPGHQGTELLNNIYVVGLPDGLRVMHTGDQSNNEDFDLWIDGLGARVSVDVLLPNCWSTDLPRLIREVAPQLVITGHENEMSHPVDHREAFSKTYAHIARVTTPVLVMAWGERYHYEPDSFDRSADDDIQASTVDGPQGNVLDAVQDYLHKF